MNVGKEERQAVAEVDLVEAETQPEAEAETRPSSDTHKDVHESGLQATGVARHVPKALDGLGHGDDVLGAAGVVHPGFPDAAAGDEGVVLLVRLELGHRLGALESLCGW